MLSKESVKSPPPVSMQTPRKMLPTQVGSHVVTPPSRTPPVPPQTPDRAPPAPPSHATPLPQRDAWADQKGYWAERRRSAGEVLKERRSMEMRRPESARPSFDRPRPQGLKSHCSWDASQRWDGYGAYTEQYVHTYKQNKGNWHQPNPHSRTTTMAHRTRKTTTNKRSCLKPSLDARPRPQIY